jgi:polysaccharide export outer membrane protein
MNRLFALTLIALMPFTGSAWAQGQPYLLRPGDTIEISILEDPSLNRTVLVRPDGRVALPLAGTVVAGGRSPEEVRDAIRRALSREFVQPPSVTVSVVGLGQDDPLVDEEAEPGRIYVLGQVARPGVFDVLLPIDALRALAIAGGPGAFAASDRIQIRRRTQDGGETVMLFDYEALERGAIPTANIRLQTDDVIVVPERRLFE